MQTGGLVELFSKHNHETDSFPNSLNRILHETNGSGSWMEERMREQKGNNKKTCKQTEVNINHNQFNTKAMTVGASSVFKVCQLSTK